MSTTKRHDICKIIIHTVYKKYDVYVWIIYIR